MPRVVISRYAYAHTNEQALEMAREARMQGQRSTILTDDEATKMIREMGPMQDLMKWAEENTVTFNPSI